MIADAFRDPDGSTSMTRTCAFILTLATCYAVAIGRDAAVIAALVGGGVVALLSRTRTQQASE